MTVAYIRTTNIYDDSRATKEIRAICEAGFNVVVLGWDRNSEAEAKTRPLFDSNVELRFFHCILPTGIGLRNIDKLVKWFRWTESELKKISDLGIVHACNLDGGYGAYRFCKKTGTALIYDIYDYYVDSHSIPSMARKTVESMENRIVSFSDTTVICTEERREQIKNAKPKNVVVIYNSPQAEAVSRVTEVYDYSYCGSLCDMRLIREILGAYKSHSHMRFAIAGNDKYRDEVERLSSEYENMDYYGTISYDRVLEIERSSKVLSAIYQPIIRNHRLCAPNKFYEALALGKPVIVCKGTGIDRIVEEQEIGIVINYDAEEFYGALTKLVSNDALRAEMGKKARLLYEKEYNWENMKDRLKSMYSAVVQNRKS